MSMCEEMNWVKIVMTDICLGMQNSHLSHFSLKAITISNVSFANGSNVSFAILHICLLRSSSVDMEDSEIYFFFFFNLGFSSYHQLMVSKQGQNQGEERKYLGYKI